MLGPWGETKVPGPQHREVSPVRVQTLDSIPLSSVHLYKLGKQTPLPQANSLGLRIWLPLVDSKLNQNVPASQMSPYPHSRFEGRRGTHLLSYFLNCLPCSLCPGDSLPFPDCVCTRVEGPFIFNYVCLRNRCVLR